MKKILTIACLLASMFLASCKKDEVSSEMKFGASLWGAEEVPAVTSAATGNFDATYNKETKVLSYTITYTGITPTAWHIHKGAQGVTGPVNINFGSTFTSPFTGTATLTADQETDLMNKLYYVNIHSAKNPSGEIRGQLLQK